MTAANFKDPKTSKSGVRQNTIKAQKKKKYYQPNMSGFTRFEQVDITVNSYQTLHGINKFLSNSVFTRHQPTCHEITIIQGSQ